MIDTDAYIRALEVFDPLVEPTVCAAIQALELPSGSRGLDAGCGIGLQTLLLAEAVGPGGHITGLDISPEFLAYGEGIIAQAGLSGSVSFQKGDVRGPPFEDATFDWVWSSCCVGYASFLDPLSTLRELVRVVRPGGRVILLAWSSEKLLPGYPLLEARLNATTSGIAPFVAGRSPELHFSRALGWFRSLGLEEATARTFAGDACAPLTDASRNALIALFEMRWPGAESELSPEDRAAYERLCLPASPEFILDHPDYYAFFTYTMFSARVV
jgi:demethylmenaquinone methyltransferase/2-methoxy-6-polyprenyl-1,4-benzoquinol methylase